MSSLALRWIAVPRRLGWVISAIVGTLMVAKFGVSLNQSLAILFSSIVLIVWTHNKANGLIAALLLFMVKAVFVRIAYAVDKEFSGGGGFDLLGITPALLVAGLIVWHLYLKIASGEKILLGRTRVLIMLFSSLAFLSIFNPANSLLVGLGGFERNILPNMMVLLSASFIFTEIADSRRLLKVLLLLGSASCVYGIGQYFSGLYPWEKDWIMDVAFKDSSSGWLTIGLRGVEFRLFSCFYNYMDFTFCNVLIFSLAISYGTILRDKWKRIRHLYILLWSVVLLLSLERMPLLMSAVAVGLVYYLKSDVHKKKRIILKVVTCAALFIIGLSLASPILKNSGAQKLDRLAELANPFAAASIKERIVRNWTPTLETIAANPLGVGIGYGSQTRANPIAARSDFWVEPHNELLQKTLETGIIGGIVFLLLLAAVFRDGLRLSRTNNRVRRLGIGFVAATIGFWLCGMVNVPFSGSSGLLYWILAGVVLSTEEMGRKVVPQLTKNVAETADKTSS